MILEGSEKYGKKRHFLGCGRLHLLRTGLAPQREIELTIDNCGIAFGNGFNQPLVTTP